MPISLYFKETFFRTVGIRVHSFLFSFSPSLLSWVEDQHPRSCARDAHGVRAQAWRRKYALPPEEGETSDGSKRAPAPFVAATARRRRCAVVPPAPPIPTRLLPSLAYDRDQLGSPLLAL